MQHLTTERLRPVAAFFSPLSRPVGPAPKNRVPRNAGRPHTRVPGFSPWGPRARSGWEPRAPPTLFGCHADGLGFERKTLAYQIDVSPEVIELI
jgi:hypothetical protein